MALRFGEYRESVDIDFLVSDVSSYRDLRQLLTGSGGLAAITQKDAPPLVQAREVRADQYGIRTMNLPKAVLWQRLRALRRLLPKAD